MKDQKRIINVVLILILAVFVGMMGYSKFLKQVPTNTSTNIIKISDKDNLYSIEIPADWKITRNEGVKGGQLSDISGESSDWKYRSDTSVDGLCRPRIYYELGVSFQFHVDNKEETPAHYGEGGGPETGVISKKNIIISGTPAIYHVFKEPCTYEGQLVDAHINYKGNAYTFRFTYNPDKYPQGEAMFINILNSIKFTK